MILDPSALMFGSECARLISQNQAAVMKGCQVVTYVLYASVLVNVVQAVKIWWMRRKQKLAQPEVKE